MKSLTKSTSLTFAILLLSGAHAVYACSGCGCSSKPVEPKKTSAASTEVKPKSDAECTGGVCNLSEAKTPAAPKADHSVTTIQLKEHIDSKKAILLDARSAKYDDGFRIPGAKALSSTATEEEIAKVIPTKDALVITYCSNTQCPASKRLADHLIKLGYTHVLEYPEGIAGWRAAGGKVDPVK
ncbi:MAG: rhodanese-like domain-containing protein [Kiritimatiellaceae bacterium]|nr:rhodanese-like domain-containing protein [Kiritimatiellaceae bacterium]